MERQVSRSIESISVRAVVDKNIVSEPEGGAPWRLCHYNLKGILCSEHNYYTDPSKAPWQLCTFSEIHVNALIYISGIALAGHICAVQLKEWCESTLKWPLW